MPTKLKFSKMHGLGNDFVMFDAINQHVELTPEQLRHIADRRFGIGCDQILLVEKAAAPGIDFRYRIFNADGSEVEHCGNGARCFVRFAREQGLTDKSVLKVQTMNRVSTLTMQADGRVTVDMGAPVFDLAQIPFDATGLVPEIVNLWQKYPLNLPVAQSILGQTAPEFIAASVAVVSMGNPHAVQLVDDVDTASVAEIGPLIESHKRFAKRVNAGFMQVVSRTDIRLRVYERGAGETLACGTGACAAVVAGIRMGLLATQVDVQTRGGVLTIEWSGALDAPVLMTGPATTVFESEINVPETA